MIEPAGGAAFVAVAADQVVGMVVTAPDGDDVMEIGVLVEDRWQRRGVGSRLVHMAAAHVAASGRSTMLAIMEPGNRALLPTLRRCGLTCRVRSVDGAAYITIHLGSSDRGVRQQRNSSQPTGAGATSAHASARC